MRRVTLTTWSLRGSIHYRRHFCLLAIAVLMLEFGVPWRPPGLVASAGFYGSLHATLLVLCLRNPGSLVSRAAFIAAAGSLSMASLWLAIASTRQVALLPLALKPVLALGLVAAVGASGYALLVRCFWIDKLPWWAVAGLTLGSVVATVFVFGIVPAARARSGLGLAAAWWFAFSTGLLCYDTRIAAS